MRSKRASANKQVPLTGWQRCEPASPVVDFLSPLANHWRAVNLLKQHPSLTDHPPANRSLANRSLANRSLTNRSLAESVVARALIVSANRRAKKTYARGSAQPRAGATHAVGTRRLAESRIVSNKFDSGSRLSQSMWKTLSIPDQLRAGHFWIGLGLSTWTATVRESAVRVIGPPGVGDEEAPKERAQSGERPIAGSVMLRLLLGRLLSGRPIVRCIRTRCSPCR